MADRITSIYEKACAKGILDPQTQSEQWFRDQLSTEQGVKSFYDHATANGMKFHPYPEFKERLSQTVSSQPSSSAQPAQPAQQQSPDRITNAFAQMPDPLYSGQYQYHQQVADKEAQMQREQAAQLPLSQQDIDRQAEIDRLRQEQFQANFERAQRGEGYSLFPTDNQAAIDALERQKPDYLRGKAKTPQEVYDQTMGAWTANTPEGQKAKAQADRDTEAVLGNIKQQFDADVDSYAAGLQKQFEAEPQVKTVAERMNQQFVSTEFKQLQDRINRGELSVADAQAQADAVWKEKYASQIQSSAEALWKEKYVPQIQSYADKLWNDTYQEMYSNEASIIQNSLFRQMTDANGDYISQQLRRLGQEEVDRSTQSLSTTIAKDIAQLEKERSKAISRASARGQSRFGAYGAIGGQMSANTAYPREKAERLALLQQAQQFLDDARKMSTGAKQSGQGFWRDLGKGFGANIGDVDTWDMGMSQLVRSANLKKIVEKYEKDKDSLTDEEKALMDAAVTYMASCAYNSDQLSRAYKAGQTTAESIPFMLQFLIMPVDAVKNKVAKGILGYGLDQFGGKALQASGKKYGLGAALKEAGTLLAGNIAAAGMQTAAFGMAKIAGGTISRMTGDIKPDFDEQGHLVYAGREHMQNFGNALWNSTVDTYVENLSEMILTSGDPIKALVRGSEWFAKSIGKSELVHFLASLEKTPFGKVAERMQFRNYPEEVAEEYVGNLIKWGASTDIHSTKEAGLDADSQIDLWLGLAPTSIAFAGLGLGSYAIKGGIDLWQNVAAANKMRDIIGEGVERRYFEDMIKSKNSEEFSSSAREFVKGVLRDKKISDDEKREILDNVYISYQSQLAKEAEQVQQTEEQQEVQQQQDRQTQLRQQAAQQAQQEVQGMAHQDGNVYYVGIKGKEDAEGYAVSGALGMVTDKDGMYSTSGRDLVTVKMNDGSVQQVPADELVVRDIPVSADELMQERTEHYFAQYANEDLFHVGDKVYLKQNGQQSAESSTIVNINDEGIEVEIIDPNGQPNTTIIPHEQAAEALAVAEGETEDNIVTYVLPDNTQLRLRKTGDGVYEDITPDGTGTIHTEDDLANMGAKPLVQEESPANTGDNGMQTPVFTIPQEDGVTYSQPVKIWQTKKGRVLADIKKTYTDKDGNKVTEVVTINPDGSTVTSNATIPLEGYSLTGGSSIETFDGFEIIGFKKLIELPSRQRVIDGRDVNDIPIYREQDAIADVIVKGEDGVPFSARVPLIKSEQAPASPAYPTDETGNPAWEQMEVPQSAQVLYDLYKGNRESAKAYADDQLKEAQKVQKAAAKQASHNLNLAQRLAEEEQNAQFKAQADAAVKYWEDVKLAIAQIKTAEELAAEQAQREKDAAKAAARRQTEEGLAGGQPAERWNNAAKIEGNAVTRTLPDGTKITGHYVLAEAGAATPSHNPFNNWNTSEGFPVTEDGRNINDRDYKNDKDAQQITMQIAQTYDGQAVQQVPVVSSEGIVYDGNGRTIAGNIAAANNTDAAYLQALTENAANFGFTPEQVASMQHPRVYLQTDADMPYNTTTFAKFNAQEKKTMDSVHRAISNAKKLTDAARDGLLRVINSYSSLDAFFASENGAKDILNLLQANNIITEQEAPEWRDKTENGFVLSADGRSGITDLLIGALFDEQTIRMLGNDKGLKQSILRAMPSIIENRQLGDYALTDDINEAIRLLYEARQADMVYKLFVRQGNLIDGYVKDRFSAFSMLLAEEMSSGVDKFRQALDVYNDSARDDANGQATMFEQRTPEDIKNEILKRYEQEQQPAEPAAEQPANEETQPPVSSTPASDEPAAEVTEPEKIVPERPNSKQLQGMSYNVAEAEDYIGRMVRNILDENGYEDVEIVGTKVIGSRVNGNAREDSDLDCLIEFKGNAREDSLFNLFEEQGIELDGVKVDINPITEGKSGTIEQFMRRSDEYLAEKAEKQAMYDALAQAEAETDTDPTEAQKKAENYKQGHVTLWGLPITIENRKGSIRRGTDANGKQWEQEMHHTYGKIRRTEGVDGDHIDVFIGPNLTSDKVFVVDQRNVDTGEFDEHKCMLGFDSLEDAQNGYLSNYEEGWQGMGTVTKVTMDEFKKWIDSSHRKTKPFAEYKSVKAEGAASVGYEEPAQEQEQAEPVRAKHAFEVTISDINGFIDRCANNYFKNYALNNDALDTFYDQQVGKHILAGAPYVDGAYILEVLHTANEELDKLKGKRDKYSSIKKRVFSNLVRDIQAGLSQSVSVAPAAPTATEQPQALTDNRETTETQAEELTPLEAAKKRKAAREAAKAAEPKNTIFTDEAYEKAKARMKARLNRLNMGIDPEMVADQIVIAGYHVERGARKFADFARALIADFGDGIRQYARQMYNYLRDIPEGEPFRAEMDDYATVMAFDIDNFDFKDRMMPAVREYEDVNGQKIVIDDVSKGRDGTVYYDLTITEPSGHVRQTSLSVDNFNKELESKGIFPANSEKNAPESEKSSEKIWSSRKNLVSLHRKKNQTNEDAENWEWLEENVDRIVEEYKAANGNKLDPDAIREYLSPRGYNGSNVQQYRTLEKALVQIICDEMLDEARSQGKTKLVFLTGHGGAGKSTATHENDRVQALMKEAGVVFDAAMNSFDSIDKRLDQAIKHGFREGNITIIPVYNNVVKSFENSLNRAIKENRVLAITYLLGKAFPENAGKIRDIAAKYPNVTIIPINNDWNNGGREETVEQAINWDYSVNDKIINQILDLYEQYIKEGRLSKDQIATIGEGLSVLEATSGGVETATRQRLDRLESRVPGQTGRREVERSESSEQRGVRGSLNTQAYEKGQKVKYKNKVDGKLYDATIDSVNADGTYNLLAPNPVFGDVFMGNISEDRISPIEQPKEEKPMSPMQRQFKSIKEQYPDAVLLFRVGDFYELYDTDAEEGSKILGITLTRTTWAKMAGFPFHALDTYLPKLIRAGKRVAICDQLEDPKKTTKTVKRGVSELVTQGTPYQETPKVENTEVAEPESVTDNQEPTIPEPNVVTDTVGEITESKHTKTGNPIWIVKPLERVSDDEYKVLKVRAKENNGYYSRFVKGFVFNSVNDANRFNNISDEQTTTEQTSADTETAINEGQSIAAEAASIERDRRDASGAEGEQRGQSDVPSSDVVEEEITTRQETIDKIDGAVEKVEKQLALLGYYEVDKSNPSKWNEVYGYRKTAEEKAIADAEKLAKQLADDLGITINKRKKLATANIPPAGGDISFRLPLNVGKELYFQIDVNPNWDGNWYRDTGNSDDLAIDHIMWRIEDPNAKGSGRYGSNHQLGLFRPHTNEPFHVTYEEVIRDIRIGAKDYLPKVETAPVESVSEVLEQAKKRQEASKKKKADKTRIPDGQQVLDLFADAVDEINDGIAQENSTPAIEEQTEPINNEDNGNTEVRNDGERESSTPQGRTAGQPADQNGTLGGSQRQANEGTQSGRVGARGEQHRVHDGERSLGTAGQRSTESVERKQSLRLRYVDEFGVEHILDANYYTLGDVYHINDRLNGDQYNVKASNVLKNIKKKVWTEIVDTPTQETEAPVAESERKNTRNFRYDPNDPAPTSNRARYDANLAAIRLLKQLQDEDRQATPEEQRILAKFTGWGGLGEFFKGEPGTTYWSNHGEKSPYQVIKELLTDEEMQAAQLSRNSAYYTPAAIIDELWNVAKHLGFKGGNILEGSAGIGNILSQMPQSISDRSNLQAVEIDSITAGILAQLYPDAQVHAAGFQEVDIPNNSQDLVITNVPFVTGLRVYDKKEKDLSKRFGNIHDFCIAKNVRKLRQGGLGIFITTSGTLDNSKDLRRWLNNEGETDVIGAFRLNRETFGGTSATSDIIVVRKRVNGQKDPRAIDVLDTDVARVAETEEDGKNVEKKLIYNRYFVEHPESMGGEMGFGFEHGDTRWGGTTAGCYPSPSINQSERLQDWVESIPKEHEGIVYNTANDFLEGLKQKLFGTTEVYHGDLPYGSLVLNSKDEICRVYNGMMVPVEGINPTKVKGHTKAEVLTDYNALKTAVEELLAEQAKGISDEGLKGLLRKLNKVYDDFVKKYGYLNRNVSLSFLRNDVQWASMAALENVRETIDKSGKKKIEVSKTDVFSKRVVGVQAEPKAENARDGVILSVQQYGNVRPDMIATWLGRPQEEVEKEIIESRLAFRDPQTGNMVVSHEYLSGNVREKLAYAEEHNENGIYDTNIEELRKVIPVDIPAHLIEFNIGSTWIPVELYHQYLKEKFGVESLQLVHVGSAWISNEKSYGGYALRNEKNRAEGVYSEKLMEQVYGHQLMMAAMNNVPLVVSKVQKNYDGTTETITDKEATAACSDKISQIKDDFVEWARGKMQEDSELAERVQKIYNERFNAIVPMLSVDKAFLSPHLPGQNHKYTLYDHQQQAVVRATTQPVMLAHEVGTGKTITLISAAMEMRRLGTAKKPMIVVQNATTPQFVKEAKDLYPNAKILTVSERDRTKEGRQEFYAKIKYNDWDLIIVPQSVFDMIPDSESRMRDFIDEKIAEKLYAIEEAKKAGVDKKVTDRMERELGALKEDLQNANMSGKRSSKKKQNEEDEKKKVLQAAVAAAKAEEMLDRRTDEVEDFDDMGIDALLIDEAHNYKHLGFATMMTRGVKGIDPSYSKRAAALYLKCQSVYERCGHRNVVFATGTPISNTAAEIWTFMKYLMPKEVLKDNDIYYFDDFVHNFGKINEQLEFATNGKFKANNRFAQYGNVPELMRIWLTCADCVLTREVGQVNDKVPEMEGGKAQDIFLPQSPSLIDIMASVRAELERYEQMSGKEKKENSHIPLTMYGVAKRAAIDPRLVDASAADEPLSKTNKAVEETLRSLKETKKYNGTVAIFCDSYRNLQTGFNLFEDIKAKLVKGGVPAAKIAIIRSEMTDAAKQKIFDAVREGEIRVIMGSTQTLGTGVNIQTRLHTLIHMDAPDRPMDYTQRNGRIIRQGNMHRQWNLPVRVLRFGVEDSLDVTSYQRLKTKAGFIDSIMNGKSMIDNNLENRVLEDVEEGIFDNPVAMLSGSQYALLKSQAERDLRKWQARKQQHDIDQILIAKKLRDNAQIMDYRRRLIETDEQFLQTLKQTFPTGKVTEYNIDGTICHNAAELKEALKAINAEIQARADKLRKEGYEGSKQNIAVSLQFNGMPFNVNIVLIYNSRWESGQRAITINKEVQYTTPTSDHWLGSPTKVLDKLIEHIEQDYLSGTQATGEINYSRSYIERLQQENELMRQREGKPFEHSAELEKAQALVDEYTEKMQNELAEKEAKYANMSSGRAVTLNEQDDEDETTPEAQITDLDYPQFTNQTEAQQLATAALVEVLNDNTDLDVFLATDEEASQIMGDDNVEFSIRREPAPKKTGIGYKVFYRGKDGKLYPPMVANPNGEATPVGVWLNADAAPVAGESKTGRPQVKAGGKGTQGGSGQLAYRPGWHLGEIPYALQFNRKDENGEKTLFPKDFVWAEVEYAADNDYQEEAMREGVNTSGKFQHSLAGLKHVPTDGFYRYRTNPNPATDPWIITGAMKVNRVLTNEEVDEIVRAAGREPQVREAMLTPNGTLYGWAIGDRIYLTKYGLNPNSPIHEYSHIWAKAMMRNNREGWQSIVDIFKGTPFWDEVVNDPNYQGLTTDDAICSEVLARYSGQRGAARMEEWAQEELHEAEQSGSVLQGAKIRRLISRAKKALADFWHWVGTNLFGIKHFDSAEQVADRVLWDMLNGTELDVTADREMQHIKERAIADGTFMKAPNGQPTNLTERQWLQVRTRAFKRWFGDWENDPQNASKVVDANGEPMVVYHGTAKDFTVFGEGKKGWRTSKLRTFYFTPDYHMAMIHSGYSRPGDNGIRRHKIMPSFLNARNIKVVENAVIEDVGYWATDSQLDEFELTYDGLLSQDGKQYVMLHPNQIKSATNNNGEFSEENDDIEMMISGYTQEKQRISNEWYAAHPRPQYQRGETLDHYQARLETYQEEEKRFREQLQAHRPSNASASTEQSERISQNQAPAFVPGVRPTPMANETPGEYALRLRQYYQLMRDERLVAEYVAEINNQADAAAKVLKKNTIVRGLLDAAKPIENFQEWMKQRGATITDESNAYTDTFLATGRVTEANEQMQRDIIRPLAKQIAKIIAPDAETGKSRLDGINIVWHNMDVAGTGSKLDGKALTPREIIGVYCQAKDCAEAIEKGLPDRGAKGFLNNLGMSHDDVIAAVESIIPRAELDELWRLINAATHFALNYDYESGRISEDTHTEFYQREFYVPQRGWRERDESGLITEYEPVGKRGNDPYNAALVKAHGRQSLASDPFAYIMSIDASSIVSSENNKIKQKFLQFCLDNENLGLQTGAFHVKKYWIMNVIDPETGKIKLDEEGNPMMEVSYVAPTAEDLSHDRTIKELIKKKRKEWAKVNQAYLERQSHGELGPQLEAAYKTKLSKIEQAIEDLEQQMHIAWNATNTNITQRTSDEKKQHEVRVLLDGQEYLIEVQDEKLANAINKKFKQHQEQLFNTTQKMRNATRFMSAVLTQYNPEFAASNFARDFQVALATLTAEHPELVGSFLKNFAACQPAVWQYAFNDKVRDRAVFRDSELGRYLHEYFKAGAATGFSYMQDLKSLRQDFDAMVNESNLRRGIKGAVGTLSMLTQVSETAVRFAGYVAARQKGMGVNEAAYLSKELTTNFDRAGEVADSGWMSWFSFFRATLNGNIKFLKALKKMPVAYSIIAAAYVAMGMLNQFLNPDDPDDEVWAGDYTRESNFVIGKWRIPTAHFLRMFFAAGVNAAKWMQGEKSFGEATYNTATFATNELLPDYLNVMNWTDWDSDTDRMTMPWDGDNYKKGVRGFIPTPISPIADVWANRDFMGATINYPADDGKKDILRAKKKTLPIYQMLTQTIYEGVGGNMNTKRKSDDPAWRSWLFDTSASSVEHVVEGYMPAGMDMFITLGEAIYDAATGTPTGPDKWPFVRKFYNAYTPERAYMQQYYLLNGRVKEFKRNMDDYQKNDFTKYNNLINSQEYRNYQEAERLVKKQKENPTTADVQALINANKQWIK